MDAASLILLILAMIAIGVIVYYSVICFQIQRPASHKLSNYSDMGPLLDYEEDYNGNHEGVIAERSGRSVDEPDASAPKPEDCDDFASASSKSNGIEPPLKSVTFQMTPECASKSPSNEGSVVLPIDEEPSLLDGSRTVLPVPHQRPFTSVTSSGRPVQPLHCGQEPQNAVAIPILISDIPQKVMSVSYEEDGLLVQEPSGGFPHGHPHGHPQGPSQVAPQQESRKCLERQKSAPESHIPHPQMFIQGNPRQVQVLGPYYSIPQIVVDSSGYRQRAPFRPVLKSPHSDPGTGKETKVFVFGSKHSVEELNEQPVKKAKLASSEEDLESGEGETPSINNEDIISTHTEVGNEAAPPLGWVLNLPRYDSKEDNKVANSDLVNEDVDTEESHPLKDSSNEKSCSADLDGDEHHSSGSQSSLEDESSPKLSLPPDYDSDDDKDIIGDSSVKVKIVLPKEMEIPKEAEVPEGSSADLHEEDESESSDPDVTEYSFQRDPNTPDPTVASVLLNEVSCYPDKIGLTNYVPLPEASVYLQDEPAKERVYQIIGHPPTPTSDTTKSMSPISSNDNSLDEINATPFSPNVLGTPPTTPPPDEKTSSDLIIQNPSSEELTDVPPSFIEIEPHRSRSRLSSSASASSSLSSTSTSSSNGSYKIVDVVDDKNGALETIDDKNGSPKLLHLKNRSNQM